MAALQFLAYNLAASLLAGTLAWLLVTGALALLRVHTPFLHASFLALPLLKSVWILAGMSLIFPWPGAWFSNLHRLALPPQVVLPWVLAWFAISVGSNTFLAWQARKGVLREAHLPEGEDDKRLKAALTCVVTSYQQSPCCESGEILCCISERVPSKPTLLISERLRSPAALVEGGTPVVIFPHGLLNELNGTELTLALAHELNHFALRKPIWRSSGVLRTLILVSPIAFLLSNYYHREEEKACDDLAVTMLNQPEGYAGMLLKSYQFARRQGRTSWLNAQPFLPGLLDSKPFISERVERVLKPRLHPNHQVWLQAACFVIWVALVYFLFLTRIGA